MKIGGTEKLQADTYTLLLAPYTFVVFDQAQALEREVRPAATELSVPSHLARLATTSRQLAPRRTTSAAGALVSQSSFIQTFVPESNNLSESQHRWASARFQPNTCKLSSLSFPSEVPVSTRTIARNLTPFNDDKDHSQGNQHGSTAAQCPVWRMDSVVCCPEKD